MIKTKQRACEICGRVSYIWSNNKCKNCASKKMKTKSKYTNFFSNIIEDNKNKQVFSFISGKPIQELSNVNLAHIFPKERYKSVSEFEENIIYLTWEEHTEFDRLLNNFDFVKLKEFMKDSWDELLYKVTNLIPFIEEQGNLKKEFENLINKPI